MYFSKENYRQWTVCQEAVNAYKEAFSDFFTLGLKNYPGKGIFH